MILVGLLGTKFRKLMICFSMPLLLICAVNGRDPRLSVCRRKWVRMNDANYEKALEHYADCAQLGADLDPGQREEYYNYLLMNMKKTFKDFFQRSGLPVESLMNLVKEVARIIDGIDDDLCSSGGKSEDAAPASCAEPSQNATSFPERLEGNDKPCPAPSLADSKTHQTRLILLGLFWLLVFVVVVQLLFILWLFCVAACIGCFVKEVSGSTKDGETRHDGPTPKTPKAPKPPENTRDSSFKKEMMRLAELQAELSSLSSDAGGSDLDLEALLAQTNLKKKPKRFKKPPKNPK